MESHYETLGLSPDASRSEIRRAYRVLLKRHHPDQGGSRERFLRIKRAYEALTGEQAPEADGGAVPQSATAQTYDPSARIDGVGPELTVRGDLLSLSLVGLVQDVPLADLLDGRARIGARRPVAFFSVHNTAPRAVEWRGRAATSFVGTDGFLYQGSNMLRPHAQKLPPTWSGTDLELQPDRAVNTLVVAQELPDDVEVAKVIYAQSSTDDDGNTQTERYLFDVRPRARETLDELPADFD